MRAPVLSVTAATLAVVGALISLALGFLIFAEDFGDVVPSRWLVVFVAASIAAVALLLVAVASGRRACALGGWRSAPDASFLWETSLSIVASAVFGLAAALSDGFPGYLLLASILAAYVTLVRWTWWTWRASR